MPSASTRSLDRTASMSQRTMPSMSCGVSPASAMARQRRLRGQREHAAPGVAAEVGGADPADRTAIPVVERLVIPHRGLRPPRPIGPDPTAPPMAYADDRTVRLTRVPPSTPHEKFVRIPPEEPGVAVDSAATAEHNHHDQYAPGRRVSGEGSRVPGPLEGVRVLEVASFVFVPAAAAILADWGAEVIKVEHPEWGDPGPPGRRVGCARPGQRRRPPVRGDQPRQAGHRHRHQHRRGPGDPDVARRHRRRVPHQPAASGADQARHRARRHPRAQPAHRLRAGHGAGPAWSRWPARAASTGSPTGAAPARRSASRRPARSSPRRCPARASATCSRARALAGGIGAALFQRERTGRGHRSSTSR